MPRLRSIACAGLAFVMCAVSVAEAAQGISLSVSQKQAGKYERRDLQQGGQAGS